MPELETIKKVVAEYADKYGADRVVLFGSYARGDMTEKSDVPWLVNTAIMIADLAGIGLVYYYTPDHAFHQGMLRRLPFFVENFYVILFVIHSIRLLKGKNRSKGLVIAFMAAAIFVAEFLELTSCTGLKELMPSVIAIIILVYYFYLAAIWYSDTREKLNESRIALERSKSNLLLAQIRPHFINSNLAVIRSPATRSRNAR